MELYSVPLALEDFLPVIFSALGLYLLAGMITKMNVDCKNMAYLGFILVALGGLSKATWKLIYALSEGQTNIVMMDNALFFFLSTGFIFVSFALIYAQRNLSGKSSPNNVWLVPGVLAIITLITAFGISITMHDPEREGRQMWFFILLGMTTIFNFLTLGLAINQSRQQKQWLALGLFVVNLSAVIILQGLARAAEQTESLQWIEQITNTIAQVGFAYAVWLLSISRATIRKKKVASPQESIA